MAKCPLCDNSKYFTLNTYTTSSLGRDWLRQFKKNPFIGGPDNALLKKLKCGECGLIYFDPPVYGDKTFYENLSKHSWYYEEDKWEYLVALEMIMKYKPESLLEVGCGSGNFLEKVSSFVNRAEGLEINEEGLNACKAKKITAVSADITAPVGTFSGKYDMILLFQVLEHLNNLNTVLLRLDNMLNKNGLLVIAVPNPEGYLAEMDRVLLDMPPHHNTLWSYNALRYISQKYSWPIIEYRIEPLRYVHYLSYLKATADKALFAPISLKRTIMSLLNAVIIKVLAPFFYASDRQCLTGQTHMVLFQKK